MTPTPIQTRNSNTSTRRGNLAERHARSLTSIQSSAGIFNPLHQIPLS